MDQLSDGLWDNSRWNELLNYAEAFSKQSGLSDDASRSELVEKGKNASLRAGLDSETSVLLCMLGESIAIVPRDLSKENIPREFIVGINRRRVGCYSN